MSNDFVTKDANAAMKFIELHLKEGYFVSAFIENAKDLSCFHKYVIRASNAGEERAEWA